MRFCPVCGAPLKISRNSQSRNPPSRTPNPNTPHTHNPVRHRDMSPPSLFETLKQAKAKNGELDSAANSESSLSEIDENTTITEVPDRPSPPPRTKIGRKIKPPVKASDLPAEKIEKIKEHLHGLNKLDKLLEASAVLRRDGTILTSAISNRYNEKMMSMIAMNIFDIATDSIKALSGGTLKLLTMYADNALVVLSHINKQTVLILITSPKSQVGLISMYSQIISQKIDKLLTD